MSSDTSYDAKIIFGDGSEDLLVTPLGANRYRLEESSIVGDDVYYHDVIEAELLNDGTLRFVRVVTPSGLKTSCYVLSMPQMESPDLPVFLDRVMAAGGNWERIFDGFLILHMLPEQESSLLRELNIFFEMTGPARSA